MGDEKGVATLSRGHSRGPLVSGRLVPGFVSRGRSVEGERSRENNRERERERESIGGFYDASRVVFASAA